MHHINSRSTTKEFDKPPSEEESLSFIRELGHSREIKYITNVSVDHLHQPWRAFTTIINKCLSRKVSGLNKKKPAKAKKDVPSTKKPATKPKPTKKKAPVKVDRGKSLNILSEVSLSEAAQFKEATKRSKKDFHISQASGSGTSTKPGGPDVPKYDSESDKESWGDNGEEDDDDEDDTEDDEGNDDGDDSDGNDDDDDDNDGDDDDDNDGNDDDDSDQERTESDRDEIPNLNQFNEEHEEEEEENIDEFTHKEDHEENKEESDDGEELYKDVNVNLRKEDVEMTDADQGGADRHNVSQ
ncbi:hypothetical protein Tco_1511979 [Tanacetum coccineum]